jgi:hypothetical protein
MLETDSTPDRWINFVLQNGWRLKADVNEETGQLSVFISNEQGDIIAEENHVDRSEFRFGFVDKYSVRIIDNEEENR